MGKIEEHLDKISKLKYKIGISGTAATGSWVPPHAEEQAELLGRLIAERGMVLMTGATTGAPLSAAKGAKQAGGLVIGMSPAHDEYEHVHAYGLPTEYHDLIVYSGFGYSLRNLLFVRSCDALITVCGRIGTLNEFTDAFEDEKIQGVLQKNGGTTDLLEDILKSAHRGMGKVVFDEDPAGLLDKVVYMLDEERRQLSEGKVPATIQ